MTRPLAASPFGRPMVIKFLANFGERDPGSTLHTGHILLQYPVVPAKEGGLP